MSSKKKDTSEFYLTVSYFFLLLKELFFSKSNAIPKFQESEPGKNHAFKTGNPNLISFPGQVRPTSEAPSFEEIEILLDEAAAT